MIAIVESGATKTQWIFVDKNKTEYSYRTAGFNPYYQTAEEIGRIIEKELKPQISFTDRVAKIYYYGAGCEAEGNKKIVAEALLRSLAPASLEVNHDLSAAAKALFGNKPGIACIAGTGSNTGLYDGNAIVENIHSLGLFLGDEGSGGYKGKLLIRQYIRKALPPHLMKAFEEEYPDRQDVILRNIYGGEMPSRYLASFAPFLIRHIGEPEIYAMVYQSFNDLFDNCITRYKNHQELPVGFVGSIAYHFKEILDKVAASKGVRISGVDPDPSKALVQYHIQKGF